MVRAQASSPVPESGSGLAVPESASVPVVVSPSSTVESVESVGPMESVASADSAGPVSSSDRSGACPDGVHPSIAQAASTPAMARMSLFVSSFMVVSIEVEGLGVASNPIRVP